MVISPDLNYLQSALFNLCGLAMTQIAAEKESAEYCAHTFNLGDFKVKFRVAKITPTKIGQFVTFWQRSPKGPIAPFHIDDGIDFFMVLTKSGKKNGLFIFRKKVLHQQGILTDNIKEGKRAIRVYPPWDKAENKQAIKTQAWQLASFIEITPAIDKEKIRLLLGIELLR
jgi:hypothetical protein